MAQAQPMTQATPTTLVPEILSFSPHFLLDDTINIANDGVARAVDAMEDFLNRWAETRLHDEPDWDADKELEQGLVSFQTLLEFHTDIAFDFFEAWSLRNIFAVPPDLPLVAPHHAGLDLDQPPEKETELLAEIDELRRQLENVRSSSSDIPNPSSPSTPAHPSPESVLTRASPLACVHRSKSI
jgi:kinetochore protein Mis12/MTW1